MATVGDTTDTVLCSSGADRGHTCWAVLSTDATLVSQTLPLPVAIDSLIAGAPDTTL